MKDFTPLIQASSADLTYIVSGGLLYRLQSGAYQQVQTLSAFDQYKIKSFQDRLIVYGWNSTTAAGKSTVRMTLYIGYFQTKLNMFNIFNITSTDSILNYIPVMISPSLTKLHYVSYASTASSHVFKQIDFSGSTVTEI